MGGITAQDLTYETSASSTINCSHRDINGVKWKKLFLLGMSDTDNTTVSI